ncbi:MAG: hypothetical protein U9R14_04430 [Patescibacteria group bacterium]|nr:hypothetical protein [Patescibacteria group bacterium]
MATLSKNSITITKQAVQKTGGFVILTLKEYKKLQEQAIPTYYLRGKEAKELDKLVKEGEKEYREGKCKTIKSLADLK